MSPSEAFNKANDRGRIAEMRVAEVFMRRGERVQVKSLKGKYPQHDLVVDANGGTFLLEVKNEDAYADSPNICIELWQGAVRRPSGISISESTICVHTMGDHVAAYRTQGMRLFVKRPEARGWRRDRFGKADNSNGGMIVPIAAFAAEAWFTYCPLDALPDSAIFSEHGLDMRPATDGQTPAK